MKTLVVYTKGNLYKVKWTGGGEVPKVLGGAYTSTRDAQTAIDLYVAAKEERTTANAKD